MTQVKFTLEADIVSAFKKCCAAEGVSMASEVREWMKTRKSAKKAKIDYHTRSHRRKAVQEVIGLLNDIMEAEANYRDNIPEHFAQRHESADNACELLAEAISCLEEAF
jgi:predicted glycosyl hydrolase (DUF1957 family)